MVQPVPEVTDAKVLIPKAQVEVKREDWKKIKKYKPGAQLRVVLIGEVRDVFATKADGGDKEVFADFTLEVEEMRITEAPKNEIAKLFEDEDT